MCLCVSLELLCGIITKHCYTKFHREVTKFLKVVKTQFLIDLTFLDSFYKTQTKKDFSP